MKNINITKKLMALLTATTIVLTSSSCYKDKKNKEGNKSSSSNITPSYSANISEEEIVSSSIAVSEIIESNAASIESEVSTSSKNETSSTSSKNSTTSSNTSSKTNTTSKKPVSTSSKASTSSKKDKTPSDISDIKQLTKENINDPEVFLHLASNFANDIASADAVRYTYEYKGQKYRTTGTYEFALLMTMMNYYYMEDSTIKAVFKDCTLEELQRYAYLIKDITFVEKEENEIFHFERYSINKKIADLQHQYHDYLLNDNGNIKELYIGYFKEEDSPYCKGQTNPGLDYLFFSVACLDRIYTYDKTLIMEMEENYSMMVENYDSFVVEIYNKTKTKTMQLTK